MDDVQALEPSEVFAARRKSAYFGHEVDWALRFVGGQEALPGYARLLFRSRPSDLTYVAVDVPAAEYPWLSLMRQGEPVQVHGRIASIDKMSIELKDARLLQLVKTSL